MHFLSTPTEDGWKRYPVREIGPKVARAKSSVERGANNVLTFGLNIIHQKDAETISTRFKRLTAKWEAETRFTSSLDEVVQNSAYQEIIRMRDDVVPLILADLAKSPKPWFYALRQITKADPIPKDAAGNMKKMTAAWLKWGRKHKFC